MKSINNKKDFYELWNQSHCPLGNRPRTFSSLEEALAFPTKNGLSLRYKGSAGSSILEHGLTHEQLGRRVQELINDGSQLSLMQFSEDFPKHSTRLINGDVWRSEQGLYFNYSHKNNVLRYALRDDGRHAENTHALMLLRECLDGNSYDFLNYLLNEYENHVVEISAFDCKVGVLGWNTIFWEVRNY